LLFKRYTITLCILILAACHKKPSDSQYHLDLKNASQPILYWIPDQHEKQLIQKNAWASLASLFVVENGKPATTPVGISGILKYDTFYITPVNLLGDDMTFEWQIYQGKDTIRKCFKTKSHPTASSSAAKMMSVYPLKDSLPCNILLFHFFFSAPMREDAQAYRHVHIKDEKGNSIPFVWRQKASWADSGKQLILMIHPGRIKRGINYATESGVLFEPGKNYTLETDEGLLPLGSDIPIKPSLKKFHIYKADRLSPGFKVLNKDNIPPMGSKQALTIAFTEAMDYGAASIGLSVQDQNGQTVKGKFSPVNDSLWLFKPESNWTGQTYQLVYNDYLADLASNHVSRLFEVKHIQNINRQTDIAFSFTPRK